MQAKYDKYLKELFELLAIPSISAQSTHQKDMEKAAEWLKKRLERLNFKAKILPTKGHSVVYAESLKAGRDRPAVLIYGHYDVQSPDPLDEWSSKPFKPEVRSNNIYARGAADDKGQFYTWIAALDQLTKSGAEKPPVNVKFLIEGEEEVGSANLDEFIEDNLALLKSDVCVLSDTHCLSENQPMIDYGLRGLSYMEISVKALAKDVHSGLYGGNVLNPANVLADIINNLKNKNHKITIPGFYDNVRELSSKEKKELERLPFTDKEIIEETGAKVVAGEKEFGYHARAGARPTLDVNGIWAGYTGEGPKTIIPGSAHAKISMRLVPNQTSKEIGKKFEKYVKKIAPKGVEVKVKMIATGEPILIDTKSKYFKSAEKAYTKVFGKKPVYELSGGSIPVTATFKNLLGIDSILMGYGLPDDGLHSPNEKLSLTMFEKGIKTNVEFLKNL